MRQALNSIRENRPGTSSRRRYPTSKLDLRNLPVASLRSSMASLRNDSPVHFAAFVSAGESLFSSASGSASLAKSSFLVNVSDSEFKQ